MNNRTLEPACGEPRRKGKHVSKHRKDLGLGRNDSMKKKGGGGGGGGGGRKKRGQG